MRLVRAMSSAFLFLPWMAAAAAQPPAPVIDHVTFRGNAEIPDAAIAGAIALKSGTALAGPAAVKADIDRIVALYRVRGFDLAVSPDIEHPAPGHLTIAYLIDEKGHGGDAGAAPPPGNPPPERR